MEVHRNPAEAFSDGPNQVPLDQIEDVLIRLLAIHRAAHPVS
jgi:2-dehydro-3-deoxyphosphooctonate aldolase (KDO 8-P synthase)